MPGSATIGSNLVDSLLGTVDDLRDSLNTDMGTRQWRVYVVRRAWSNDTVGDAPYTDTETELVPQPLVQDHLDLEVMPAGMTTSGDVDLSEISLTYTYGELYPSPAAGEEVMYKLADAHGQGIPDRYFVAKEPPKPDRVQTIGWMLKLKLVTVDGCG